MSLRIFILFHPSPTHETWQYETGVIPFNPDRKVDAGAQHEDLHTGVEPWGQRGRQAASTQETWSKRSSNGQVRVAPDRDSSLWRCPEVGVTSVLRNRKKRMRPVQEEVGVIR